MMFFSVAPVVVEHDVADGAVLPVVVDNVVFIDVAVVATAIVIVPSALFFVEDGVVHGTIAPVDVEKVVIVAVDDDAVVVPSALFFV
jgi:hypothetical protein